MHDKIKQFIKTDTI